MYVWDDHIVVCLHALFIPTTHKVVICCKHFMNMLKIPDGLTTLHLASINGHVAVVRLLV